MDEHARTRQLADRAYRAYSRTRWWLGARVALYAAAGAAGTLLVRWLMHRA